VRLGDLLIRILAITSLASCVSIPAELKVRVPEAIAAISPSSCEAELRALQGLGVRPADDAEQTERVLQHLESRLHDMGYETYREAAGSYAGVEQWNLFAELRGREHPEVICEIGAHYDTVHRSPGADDNGSGVAGTLQVAASLHSFAPARTIRFCFFAAEEVGLLGSAEHVAQVLSRNDERVDGFLDLEMIGYASTEPDSQDAPVRIPILASLPRTGDFILVAGNFGSGGLGNVFEACAREFVPELKYYSANRIAGFFADAARSDHSSYWEAGLRGIMISDTANFRNPHYHRSTDTIETIDFEFMSRVTRASAATMMVWAGHAEGNGLKAD